VGEGECEG